MSKAKGKRRRKRKEEAKRQEALRAQYHQEIREVEEQIIEEPLRREFIEAVKNHYRTLGLQVPTQPEDAS